MLAVALTVLAVAGLFAVGVVAHGKTLPTMGDVEARNHAAARALDDAALGRALRSTLTLLDDDRIRAEIEAVLGGARPPEDAAERWSASLWQAVRQRGVLLRPGTVEEVWYGDGVLREYARRSTGR